MSANEPFVSVIIPALNEADSLGEAIAALQPTEVPYEVIVVDAGSSDETVTTAATAGAHVLQSFSRQRANQLNLGARQAHGAILLFLHADTLLPSHALDLIVTALEDQNVVGGAFARRYAFPSVLLRATCVLAFCKSHIVGWHLGDQALFVRSGSFFYAGGFREVARLADLDFSRRLRKFGRTVTLRPCAISSPRRFDRFGASGTKARELALTIR